MTASTEFRQKNWGGCSQWHPTKDSLYFSKRCWLFIEFLDFCSDLLPDFSLKTGELRNCRSVCLSPRRSFLLRYNDMNTNAESYSLYSKNSNNSNLQQKQHVHVNLRMQWWLLIVHHHGAAPLATRNWGGISGIRRSRAPTGELAIGCRGQIGHITQTQAPPCCPYTKPTCRNVREDVIHKKRRQESCVFMCKDQNREKTVQWGHCFKTWHYNENVIRLTHVLTDAGDDRLLSRKHFWQWQWMMTYVSCTLFCSSVACGVVREVECHRRNLQNWTGRCLFLSSRLQPEGWREANYPAPLPLCVALEGNKHT